MPRRFYPLPHNAKSRRNRRSAWWQLLALLLITAGIAVGVNHLRMASPSAIPLQARSPVARPPAPEDTGDVARAEVAGSAQAVALETLSAAGVKSEVAAPELPLKAAEATDTTRERKQIALPTITLYNGCGVKLIGERAQRALERKGFSVIEVRNARHFKYAQSEILDRARDRALGNLLAESLGLTDSAVTWDTTCGSSGSDVSLIIGGDYKKLKWKL